MRVDAWANRCSVRPGCQIFRTVASSTSSPQQRPKPSSAAPTATSAAADDAPVSNGDKIQNRGAAMLQHVADHLTNLQLLRWMFRFVRPVIGLVLVACFWLALWVAAEVMTIRQAGLTINHINSLHPNPESAVLGFWGWLHSADPQAVQLLHLVKTLLALVGCYAFLRYLREVSSSKMSMNLVFYIREAIYDKLQR